MISFAIGEVFVAIINIWIKDYFTFYVIQGTLLLLIGAGFLTILESPAYLYHKKQVDQLKDTLVSILRVNVQDDIHLLRLNEQKIREGIERINKDRQLSKQIDLDDSLIASENSITLLEKLSIYFKIGCFTLIVVNMYIIEGILTFIPQEIGIENIYVNMSLLGFADIIAYGCMLPIVHLIKRRKSLILVISGYITMAMIEVFMVLTHSRGHYLAKMVETTISIITRMLMCMNFTFVFNFGAELFDIKYRGIVIGISLLVGRVLMGYSAFIVDLAHHLGVHPIAGMIGSSVIALIATIYLPETLIA